MAGSAGARPSTESREDGAFLALDARTATDVWAAGWQARGSAIMPLVRHFDGTAWRQVTVPNIGEAQIKGVAALSANDVWFVGELWNDDVAFALHWNGTALSGVPVPRPGLMSNLNAVSASPGGDVWAVGDYTQLLMPHKVAASSSTGRAPRGRSSRARTSISPGTTSSPPSAPSARTTSGLRAGRTTSRSCCAGTAPPGPSTSR